MQLPDGIGDLQIRAYFASVIGGFRSAFGKRGAAQLSGPGTSQQLVSNGTRDKVLSISVSRSDLAGGTVAATFSQHSLAGTSDFPVNFTVNSVFRFVLYPDDFLTITQTGAGAMNLVTGQEAY